MEDHVNHSLDRRRDARDQQREVVTQTTVMTIDITKIIVRFQADLLAAWCSNVQIVTNAWIGQLDAFTADAERVANYTQQTGQRG